MTKTRQRWVQAVGTVGLAAMLVLGAGPPAHAGWVLQGYFIYGDSKSTEHNILARSWLPAETPPVINVGAQSWLNGGEPPVAAQTISYTVGGQTQGAGVFSVAGEIAPVFRWVGSPTDRKPTQIAYVENSTATAVAMHNVVENNGTYLDYGGAAVAADDGLGDASYIDPQHPMRTGQPGMHLTSTGSHVRFQGLTDPCMVLGHSRNISATVTSTDALYAYASVTYSVQVLDPGITVRRTFTPGYVDGDGDLYQHSCTIAAGGMTSNVGEQEAEVIVGLGPSAANSPYSMTDPIIMNNGGLQGASASFQAAYAPTTDYAGNVYIGKIVSSDQVGTLTVYLPTGNDASSPPAQIYQIPGFGIHYWTPDPGFFKSGQPYWVEYQPYFLTHYSNIEVPICLHLCNLKTDNVTFYKWQDNDYKAITLERGSSPRNDFLLNMLASYSSSTLIPGSQSIYKAQVTTHDFWWIHPWSVKYSAFDTKVSIANPGP